MASPAVQATISSIPDRRAQISIRIGSRINLLTAKTAFRRSCKSPRNSPMQASSRTSKTVLKELRRRGLVQLLPDEIVRYRKTTALPTELSTSALAYAAEQMRLLGNTLVQSMRDPSDASPREFAAYVASEPIKVASDVLDISQPAMLARIASFIQGIEIEFGRGANKSRKSKAPSKTIGVSVYTWRKK